MEIKYATCGIHDYRLKVEPLGVKCSRCRVNEAVVDIKYARQKLCKDCFNEFFINRVRRTVEKYRMFRPGERVAVAVSGGKDSVALLHALKKAFPEQDIVAIHINLGIAYYSDHLEEVVRKLTSMLDVPLEIYNLKDREGYTIDDFLRTRYGRKMCSVCGIVKRNIFSRLSAEVDADVVATGHNLDDTVGTMFASFFAGDFESISRLKPVLKPLVPGQPRKIKPLITTPERENLIYVVLNELPVQSCSCPHALGASVSYYKQILDRMEERNPNVKHQLLSVFTKKLIPMYEFYKKHEHEEEKREEEVLQSCKICGQPTSSPDGICSKCRRVMELQKVMNRPLILEMEPESARKMIEEGAVVLDVRSPEQYASEHIEGAINIPRERFDNLDRDRQLKKTIREWKGKNILVYCNTGTDSYAVTVKLRNRGYKAYNLKGGIEAWKKAGFPILQPAASD